MMNAGGPLITVVFPMFNLRGEVLEGIRSWTSEQTLPRERYRVIIAYGDKIKVSDTPDLGLVDHDCVVKGPSGSDGALWNTGAAHAATPWIVFTEGHCRADPGCLAAVEAWIRSEPSALAGNFAVGHLMRNLQAKLSDRWFALMQAEWRKSWRRLHRAGFAIRSDVFHAVAGFEPEFGEFSVPMLSARLASRGVVVGDIPHALVIHCDDEDMSDHHRATANYACGEAFARSRNDAAFFERYFGHNAAWTNQLSGYRAAARLRRAQRLRRLVRLAEFAVEKTALPAGLQFRTFLRAHARTVEAEYIEWVYKHPAAPAPPAKGASRPIQNIAPGEIVGVHGLETYDSQLFRWSGPVLTFRGFPENDRELRIRTNALRGDPVLSVRAAFADGRRLPNASIRSEDGVLIIRTGPEGADEITVICRAMKPWRRGVDDRRALGIPIFSIETRS